MERPVNMQKFMDDVIDNFYAGYAHLLACQIKDEGFTASSEYNEAIGEYVLEVCGIK